MKILHLISSSGFLGAENVVLELALQSKLSDINVVIGVLKNSQNPNLELANVAKENGLDVEVFHCNGRFDKKTITSIRHYITTTGINIVHSHNYKSNFYTWKALLGCDAKWIVTRHGKRSGFKISLYQKLDNFIVRNANRVVAVSDSIARELEAAGIQQKKITTIYNGINIERFKIKKDDNIIRQSLGITNNTFVVGTVSALTKEKGHIYLLKAAQKLIQTIKNIVFVIVGDGNERVLLERQCCELKIKNNVLFTGMRRDIPDILSAFDLFVMPSLDEGLPMALLEAMAAGVPVVATKVGAIPKVIDNEINGILIPPKDQDAIFRVILNIFYSRTGYLEMAKQGIEKIRNCFSSAKMTNEYLVIYKMLCVL